MGETRTVKEILAYRGDDGFGLDREALSEFLTFEEARPWLKPDAKGEGWEAKPRTAEAIKETIFEYIGRIGLSKAVNHRGISASRTIDKLRAWCWLMGDDKAVQLLDDEPYQNYGAPKLKAVCQHLGYDWSAVLSPYQQTVFEAQARGKRCQGCQEGDESGCGQ